MRKTASQIESDMFTFIKSSALMQAVKGGIYRDGQRPLSSNSEDIVVKFMTGLAGDIELGTVTVHIYVPDIRSTSGVPVKDISRIRTLEGIADAVISQKKSGEYFMRLGNTIQSFKAEGDIAQHFIDIKIKYKRVSF